MLFKPGSGSADLTQVTGVLGVTHAGTGLTVFAVSDMMFAHNTAGLTRLAKGNDGDYLKMSASLIPTWTPQTGNFATFFTQSGITITSGHSLTLNHGLGSAPALVQLRLVCQTNDSGWTAGDEVLVNFNQISTSGSDNYGTTIRVNATNIFMVFGNVATPFNGLNPGSVSGANFTSANWRLKVSAWK